MNEDTPTEESTPADLDERKPIVQSRWVAKSNVARYDKRTLDGFSSYVEEPGWHKGAKVRKQ